MSVCPDCAGSPSEGHDPCICAASIIEEALKARSTSPPREQAGFVVAALRCAGFTIRGHEPSRIAGVANPPGGAMTPGVIAAGVEAIRSKSPLSWFNSYENCEETVEMVLEAIIDAGFTLARLEFVECQAEGCDTLALTEFMDGAGKWLRLCEHHGDLLAVGFPLDAPTQETQK